MKTLFGMTAAVLLVVSMLFVFLPGTAQAEGKKTKPKKCVKDGTYVDRTNPHLRKLSLCEENGTKAVTYEIKCYEQYICKDGKLEKLDQEVCEEPNELSTHNCKAPKICKDGKCVCPPAGKMLQVMSGAQKACGCTSCNECQQCAGEKCVPIDNPSLSDSKCLKKQDVD